MPCTVLRLDAEVFPILPTWQDVQWPADYPPLHLSGSSGAHGSSERGC